MCMCMSAYYFYFITPFHLRFYCWCSFFRARSVRHVALGLFILLCAWSDVISAKTLPNSKLAYLHIFSWNDISPKNNDFAKKWQRFKLLHSAHFRQITWIMMSGPVFCVSLIEIVCFCSESRLLTNANKKIVCHRICQCDFCLHYSHLLWNFFGFICLSL